MMRGVSGMVAPAKTRDGTGDAILPAIVFR